MADQQTYLDMGYDSNGMAIAVQPVLTSANQDDSASDTNSVNNSNISGVSASKIRAGTITAATAVGDDSIVLDGPNKAIKVYDGVGNVSVYIAGGSI